MFDRIDQPNLSLHDVFESLGKFQRKSEVLKLLLLQETMEGLLKIEDRYLKSGPAYKDISPSDAAVLLTNIQGTKLFNNNFSKFKEDGNNKLRIAIRDTAKQLNDHCPICGNPVPDTIEHVLPKSTYPDLSLTPINLVPLCRHCNSQKLDSKDGFHPYFEDLSDLSDLLIIINFSITNNDIPSINFAFRTPAKTKLEEYFYEYGIESVALASLTDRLSGTIKSLKTLKSVSQPYTTQEISTILRTPVGPLMTMTTLEKKLFSTLDTEYLDEFTNYLNV